MTPPVVRFIQSSGASRVYDPFAGDGDLLLAAATAFDLRPIGLDIDARKNWPHNDGLVSIPFERRSVVITNPPYLTRYSAARKGLYSKVSGYFDATTRSDLYMIALDRCLETHGHVVAIIPETFINSNYPKERLALLDVIEHNPFLDTTEPVCVACFGPKPLHPRQTRLYKNGSYVMTLAQLDNARLRAAKDQRLPMSFNSRHGNIAIRAVDGYLASSRIAFVPVDQLDYDLARIRHSSRLITIVDLPELPLRHTGKVITTANSILNKFRERTQDLALSPFKGNSQGGVRRRRLDYATARAILQIAVHEHRLAPGPLTLPIYGEQYSAA